MGQLLEGLLKLQAVERQLAQVRGRIRTRRNIVRIQEQKVQESQGQGEALHERSKARRMTGDGLELELKVKEEQAAKLRTSLNSAKTNKEYATILTQLNTLKADNAKIEEQTLAVLQDIESVQGQVAEAEQRIAAEQQRLQEMQALAEEEVRRLEGMIEKLTVEREEATRGVDASALRTFERIAGNYDGEAMAEIQIHGARPPYDYICGGYMALNAEHVNALRTRDEIRTCDNCQRILFLTKEDAT